MHLKMIAWQAILLSALSGLLGGTGWAKAPVKIHNAVARPWQIVTSPNPSTVANGLSGVAALSAHNVWAVGSYRTTDQRSQALIEHFDGRRWSVVPSPTVTDTGGTVLHTSLSAVSGVSPRDVWAVGYSQVPDTFLVRTLIERFDGVRWRVVASPNASAGQNYLQGVVALSSRNVWAVGLSRDAGGFPPRTLIEHFDGVRWSVVASPNVGSEDNEFSGISAVSPRDIWAVGRYGTATVEQRTLVEHYNGVRWSVVASPNITSGGNVLSAVAAATPRDVWAVGYLTIEDESLRTLILHYDGRRWSIVASPNATTGDNRLWSIAIASPRDIWAVGSAHNASTVTTQTLIEHFDGRKWSVVPSPSVASVDNRLLGVAALSATQTWAVGATFNSNLATSNTLIERRAP